VVYTVPMPDNIVNFNKARKAKARHQKVIKAAENRVKFGMKKSEKEKAKALTKSFKGIWTVIKEINPIVMIESHD